ncbi:MAG: hypothetical protein ACD_28C00156G0001 [uncultured bacterium]|nr:MAG: hypothetical protein ACD_28C00156G0001 [uncultured bacterium]KKT73290.1 MAG: hypothetical protein UW70_C0087G0008 [Candidatus Peregrinibacteria bacterium GW2011_GWA2_44_7]
MRSPSSKTHASRHLDRVLGGIALVAVAGLGAYKLHTPHPVDNLPQPDLSSLLYRAGDLQCPHPGDLEAVCQTRDRFDLWMCEKPLAPQLIFEGHDERHDLDCDGVPDTTDNCEETFNPSQSDSNGDGKGDACDWDQDGAPNSPYDKDANPSYHVPKSIPSQRWVSDYPQHGRFGDDFPPSSFEWQNKGRYVPDYDFFTGGFYYERYDDCPTFYDPNPVKYDFNCNGVTDGEEDKDNDGTDNDHDNCREIPNPDQKDADGDGWGNACDEYFNPDRDKDGWEDTEDVRPDDPQEPQRSRERFEAMIREIYGDASIYFSPYSRHVEAEIRHYGIFLEENSVPFRKVTIDCGRLDQLVNTQPFMSACMILLHNPTSYSNGDPDCPKTQFFTRGYFPSSEQLRRLKYCTAQ